MIKKTKFFIIALSVLALTGCASSYYLDGKKYENAQAFQAAVDENTYRVLASVTPLPQALTSKELLFVIPDTETLYQESLRRHTAAEGTVGQLAKEQYKNLAIHSSKGAKGDFEAVKKRGIYKNVRLMETQSMINDVAPTSEYDVLSYSEASIGSGQQFYSSEKHGKQVFAHDKSGTSPEQKIQKFLEAIQMMAIRE